MSDFAIPKVKYLDPPADDAIFTYLAHKGVDLITPLHFDHLPDGTRLTSIRGEQKIKGVDYIDQDTRGGFICYGFPTDAENGRIYSGSYRTE